MMTDRKDDDKEFFDRAIKTLEEYTTKVKTMRQNFILVKKQQPHKKKKNVNEMPPAGVKGSVVDTSMIHWKQTLRPYC